MFLSPVLGVFYLPQAFHKTQQWLNIFFYTNYHKLVHNGEHDNKQGKNQGSYEQRKAKRSVVKYQANQSLLQLLDHAAYFSGSIAIKKDLEW